MGESNEQRFSHLFTAVRDLAKIWNIDIPQELETYMKDMEELLSMEEFDKINFAEAAMLIQGSTNVYSKRVETLYDLVFGVLESIAHNRKKTGGKAVTHKRQFPFLTEGIDPDMVCIIDDLIRKGKNIDLEDAGSEEPLLHRRIPLWLLPREESDRRKHEFKVNGCFIHSSGAFLLSESDAMMSEHVDQEEVPYEGEYDIAHFLNNPPTVPAPPMQVHQVDTDDFIPLEEVLSEDKQLLTLTETQKKELERREKEERERLELKCKESALKTAGTTPMGFSTRGGCTAPALATFTPGAVGDELAHKKELDNPFHLLDPHELIGIKSPMVTGQTGRNPPASLLRKYKELMKIKIQVNEDRLEDTYFDSDPPSMQLAASAYLNQCEDLFFSTAPHKLRDLLVPKMGFPASMLHYEDYLFKEQQSAEQERREKIKQLKLADKGLAGGGDGGDAEAQLVEEDVGPEEPESEVENEPWGPSQLDPTQIMVGDDADASATEMRRQQVAQLEAQIEEAQKSYEQLVRHHLDNLTQQCDTSLRMTGIYKSVREWQDALIPVLDEQSKRREFDFQLYGLELLDSLDGQKQSEVDERTKFPFSELVDGLPRYEVCRLFLTSLFLTNQGNLDIEYANNDEVFKFILHLLKSQKNFDALADEPGRAFAAAVKGKMKKKKGSEVAPIAPAPPAEEPQPIANAQVDDPEGARPKGRAKKRVEGGDGNASSKKKKKKVSNI
eukprot:GEMP01014926.1.p1 GENE.GEMP01014926.1~~GEMP01014926.1.p1  ORF type:complete len:725 (+),score=185.76 GEMP01014926.1:200-2374(+)